jgi:Secretion system C-terminal sorting domain
MVAILCVLATAKLYYLNYSSFLNKYKKQAYICKSAFCYKIKEAFMKYAFLFCLMLNNLIYAQHHDNNTIMGGWTNYPFFSQTSNLSFDNNTLQVDTNFICNNLPISLTSLSMSDANGDLLFYTNGIYVHNANCQKINSADTNKLNPGYFSNQDESYGYNFMRSTLSLPHTDSSNLYYLFHTSYDTAGISTNYLGLAQHFYYTLIDMADVSGYIRKKNRVLLSMPDSFPTSSFPVATKHANGKDWWLIIPTITYQKAFHSFLIKGDSIIRQPMQVMADTFITRNWEIIAREFTFNHKGDKLIHFGYKNQLQIYNFNRCTGSISLANDIFVDDTTVNSNMYYGAAAVSANDRFLYLGTKWHILQYDLEAVDIAASKEIVATYNNWIAPYNSGFPRLSSMPDGKIYGNSDFSYLHVIDSPNLKGLACNVRQRAIYTGQYTSWNGVLSIYPNYRLGADTSCWLGTAVHSVAGGTNDVILYPNPARTVIYLQSDLAIGENTKIFIYNQLGQLLKTVIVENASTLLEINVADLPNGAYTVRIDSKPTTVSMQFSIDR